MHTVMNHDCDVWTLFLFTFGPFLKKKKKKWFKTLTKCSCFFSSLISSYFILDFHLILHLFKKKKILLNLPRHNVYVHTLYAKKENTVYKGIINTCDARGMNLAGTIKGVQVTYWTRGGSLLLESTGLIMLGVWDFTPDCWLISEGIHCVCTRL